MKLIKDHGGLIFALFILLFVAGFGGKASYDEKRKVDAIKGLARAFDQTGTAVIASDRKGTIQFWTKGAEEVFGYTMEEALGEHISMLMPKGLKSVHEIAFREAFKSGDASQQKVRCATIHKDGYVKRIRLNTWRTESYAYAVDRDWETQSHELISNP